MSSANNTEVANGQSKIPAQEHDSESAPLLDHDGSEHVGGDDGNAKAAGKTQRYLRKSGRWLLKNRMVVAIITLLIGGFIALCVYFGGMCDYQLSYAPACMRRFLIGDALFLQLLTGSLTASLMSLDGPSFQH